MAVSAKKKTELAGVPNFDAPFLSQRANKENAEMNQYWYSESSIQVMRHSHHPDQSFSSLTSGHCKRGSLSVNARRICFNPQHILLAS
jgi:hypothetical protein